MNFLISLLYYDNKTPDANTYRDIIMEMYIDIHKLENSSYYRLREQDFEPDQAKKTYIKNERLYYISVLKANINRNTKNLYENRFFWQCLAKIDKFNSSQDYIDYINAVYDTDKQYNDIKDLTYFKNQLNNLDLTLNTANDKPIVNPNAPPIGNQPQQQQPNNPNNPPPPGQNN